MAPAHDLTIKSSVPAAFATSPTAPPPAPSESEYDFVLLSDDESIEVLDNGDSDAPLSSHPAKELEEPKTVRYDCCSPFEENPLATSSQISGVTTPLSSHSAKELKEPKTVRYDCCSPYEENPDFDWSQYSGVNNEQVTEQDEAKPQLNLPEVVVTAAEETLASLKLEEEEDELSRSVNSESTALVGQQQQADETFVEDGEEVKIEEQQAVMQTKAMKAPVIAYFSSADGKEYVRVEQQMSWKVDQLNCSARLTNLDLEIRLHNEGCLMLVDENFIAKVKFADLSPLKDSTSFVQAKTMLFWQLRIVRILQDELTANRDRSRGGLLSSINRIRNKTGLDHICTVDAIQLIGIIQNSEEIDFLILCEKLRGNTEISTNLREQAVQLEQLENAVVRRNRFLNRFHVQFTNQCTKLHPMLEQFYAAVMENHTKSLLEKAPQYLQEFLKNLSPSTIIQIHVNDIKVFHDMEHVLNQAIFQKPLQDLAKRWTKNVVNRVKSRNSATSLGNPVYYSLCQSLEQLIGEITSKTDHKAEDLLKSDSSGWHPLKTIKWKSESDYTKCIDREYKFIFKLLKHFDPASENTKPFEYQARRLVDGSTVNEYIPKIGNIFRRLLKRTQANPLGISDEFYVWYCLLDDVLAHVLPSNDACKLDVFEHVLQNFVLLISNAAVDQMETIRVITHNTLRFIVQTYPFLDADKVNSCEDKQILQFQLDAINRLVMESNSTNSFRDLIDVFSCYWKCRNEIIENIPAKHALAEMDQIKSNLLTIVLVALQKNVKSEVMVGLFRAFNDFLIDLDNVSFDWLIKPVSMFKMGGITELKLVEPIDNKWTGTDNQTYRVIDPKKFRKLIRVLIESEEDGPKHCTIEVITKLLEFITSQLQHTRWAAGSDLSDYDQVASTTAFISVIRSTLLYLDEQAEYVSLDLFMDESLKPFSNVTEHSESLNDFVKRIGLIKDCFYFFRKQNEMSIEQALEMYRELNGGENPAEPILQAFNVYTENYEQYMTKTIPEITTLARRNFGELHFKGWNAGFKQNRLPILLAAVSAVWSIMASKDVSGTGKYLKPHCIQVLCVLKLLGSDSVECGIAKHLAQVLTGQGKSLVLALIAAVFALTGHQVQVVCYNKYLVERDEKDFAALFKHFGKQSTIKYSTYDGMANLVIAPEVDGKPVKLRSLVEDCVRSETSAAKMKKPKVEKLDKSVILMDEVDVFFSKDYYGNGYYPVATPTISGLGKIQEKIWSLVKNVGLRNWEIIATNIYTFIASSNFDGKQNFDKFYNKPGTYDLLVYENNVVVRKSSTNKILFADHLQMMITDAINVASTTASYWKDYKLNQKGVITCKYNERFVSYFKVRYLSVFNYFRLKTQDFVSKVDSDENYGYLNIRCGALSYAMLPKNFPLILGVTGTLTTLNRHEKQTIEQLYNIRRSSVMPTFFGCSNMQFDPQEHFNHVPTESRWLSQIFTQAHAAIVSKRAVIVFFQDETALEMFQSEYSGQFDRLNVLTENTDENKQEQLISEAGVARTVTLATRGMGRGVDYKSSVAVEKNGGVHVIQTFFSLDVKEETQIRGRTARKDNKGSYELIVCGEHLKEQGLIRNMGEGLKIKIGYASLDTARADKSLYESQTVAATIEKESSDHQTTMAYLQSFFK